MASIEALASRFGVPGVVRVEAGPGSLPRLAITSDLATAEIYLHGAHVTRFQPRGAEPVLFMSEESSYEPGKPIRGGVPVIFPWFGPRAGHPEAPAHGLVRTRSWELEACDVRSDGAVEVALGFSAAAGSPEGWPDPFRLRLRAVVSRALELFLEIQGAGPLPVEEALHTYLQVGDVRQASVTGLEDTGYLDKVDGMRPKVQDPEPIRISGETDRVYLKTSRTCVVRDPVLKRELAVAKDGSASTVLWNPWIEKARKMSDFGDEEWPRMLCIETANVGESALRLGPGASHRMRAHVSVVG